MFQHQNNNEPINNMSICHDSSPIDIFESSVIRPSSHCATLMLPATSPFQMPQSMSDLTAYYSTAVGSYRNSGRRPDQSLFPVHILGTQSTIKYFFCSFFFKPLPHPAPFSQAYVVCAFDAVSSFSGPTALTTPFVAQSSTCHTASVSISETHPPHAFIFHLRPAISQVMVFSANRVTA